MRIVAGYLGGRTFKSPNGHRTHPMSDKVRGAIFNMLGDIKGLSVLDPFAGSGALSFEAISRGAARAIAIDSDKKAQVTIGENIRALDLNNRIKAIRANASSWSDNNPDLKFDIILCDPPYDKTQEKILQKLVKHLEADGVFMLSWPGGRKSPDLDGLTQISSKDYGDAIVVAYKLTKNPTPEFAWKAYKITAPYLVVIFISLAFDSLYYFRF